MTDLIDFTPLDQDHQRAEVQAAIFQAFAAHDAASQDRMFSPRASTLHDLEQRLAAFDAALPAKIVAILKELGIALPSPDDAKGE